MFCLWKFDCVSTIFMHYCCVILFSCLIFATFLKKIASEDAALTLWQKMMSDEQVMTFPPFLTRRKYKSAKYLQNQSNFLFINGKLEWLWPFCKNLSKMFNQQNLFWSNYLKLFIIFYVFVTCVFFVASGISI